MASSALVLVEALISRVEVLATDPHFPGYRVINIKHGETVDVLINKLPGERRSLRRIITNPGLLEAFSREDLEHFVVLVQESEQLVRQLGALLAPVEAAFKEYKASRRPLN